MSGLRPALGFVVMLLVVGVVAVILNQSNGQADHSDKHANTAAAVALADEAPMCAPRKDNPQRMILPVGAQVMDFELKDTSGGSTRLANVLAKGPVLLEFFASWCPHCQHSVDAMHTIHEMGDVTVLAINSGERPEQPSTAATFKAEYDIPYTILDRPASTLLDRFCLEGFPLFYLLDKNGTVLWHHTGTLNDEKGMPELTKIIKQLT
jgi:peroxiredoxin